MARAAALKQLLVLVAEALSWKAAVEPWGMQSLEVGQMEKARRRVGGWLTAAFEARLAAAAAAAASVPVPAQGCTAVRQERAAVRSCATSMQQSAPGALSLASWQLTGLLLELAAAGIARRTCRLNVLGLAEVLPGHAHATAQLDSL